MSAFWLGARVRCVCKKCKQTYYAGHICPFPFVPKLRGGKAAQLNRSGS